VTPDNMGSTARELSGVMFADLQKDYHSNYFPQPRIGDIDFKVTAGFRIEDWLTPTAMLSRDSRKFTTGLPKGSTHPIFKGRKLSSLSSDNYRVIRLVLIGFSS
jgi:hypothetical protein